MKRYFLICLVLISVLSFGQRKEYNKAGKLFLNKEYAAANEIIEKILVDYNIDKLDIELKYYILTVASDSNYYLNNYEKALNYYIELKKIVVDGKIEVQDKKTFVSRIDKLTEELQGKIKKEGIISENNSNDNTSASLDNGTKLVASKSMSDDKTVTLTVTGTGKTIEEAKQNALRSAIEQAFGTFISSKTEILNDNLVKDEIVSIANGNIQKFDVISEVQIPEIGYATTLKATVSVTKLTSFVESKGVIVEFKGSLFSFNIKQQIFNEKNEIKAITDMCDVTKKIADASFNFLIKANEPIAVNGNNEQWSIPITIGIQPNKNFFTSINYIFNTLKALTLTKEEANDYKKLGKKIYPVSFAISEDKYDYFILRTAESIKYLIDQIYYFNNAMINFKISNGLVDIDLKDYYKTSFCIYGGEAIRSPPKDADKFELRIQDIKFRPIRFDSQSCDLYPSLFKRHCCPDNKSIPCFNYKNLYDKDIEYYLQHYGVRVFTGKFSFVDNLNMSLKIVDNQNGLLISFIGVSEDEELVVLNLKDDKSLDEINKITEYKISKKMTYARLSYNTNNWGTPSGPYGKSRNIGVHEFIYGFGFEEWLFSQNHFLSDKNDKKYHYGYLEGINKNYKQGDENESLVLFTINNNLHQRFIVGEIKIWQKVDANESLLIVQNNPELIEEMREQVAAVTNNNFIALDKFDLHRHNGNDHQLFNIKFDKIDFDFKIDNPVNQDHNIIKFNRFWLYRR